jgi:hypothetical protein
LLLAGIAGQAVALDAVLQIKEDAYYTQYKAAKWPGASLKKGYAPFPVFAEGWASTPREGIVDYKWDFGDGTPFMWGTFNTAHVYEKPGTYWLKLVVYDQYGNKDYQNTRIDVLAPNGTTYYVDSAIGNDANDGKSTARPWRTATKAFTGINNTRYKPGDRVLFKRGQTFDVEAGLVHPASFYSGWGYSFGAFGTGAKPIIQKVGTSTDPIIKIGMTGMAHFAIMDLEFRTTSKEGVPSGEVYAGTCQSFNLLFLRLDIRNMRRAFGFSGDYANRRINGVFVVGCDLRQSYDTMIYARAARFAMLNNTLDLSSDHLIYTSYMDKAIYYGNSFSRPAFGRVALRISGATNYDNPTNNVVIANNYFEGWIDPETIGAAHNGGGTRYNYVLLDIGPNVRSTQAIQDIEVANNTLKNAECLLSMGVGYNVNVHDNLFTTVDPNVHAQRIRVGHQYELRPMKNVNIHDNVIISNEQRIRWAGIFEVQWYDPTYPYNGEVYHKNINFNSNRVELSNSDGSPVVWIQNNATAQASEVHSDYNTIFTPSTSNIFLLGGDYWTGPIISMDQWRAKTGNDIHSTVGGLKINLADVPLEVPSK